MTDSDAAKDKAANLARDLNASVRETQQTIERLRQKAAETRQELEQTEAELEQQEQKLRHENGDDEFTVAGYDPVDLLMAPLKPPQPAESSQKDPEVKAKKHDVKDKKQFVHDAKKEAAKLEEAAGEFNQRGADVSKDLSLKAAHTQQENA